MVHCCFCFSSLTPNYVCLGVLYVKSYSIYVISIPLLILFFNFPLSVYWTCQLIARVSNVSMRHWQQMGGVSIIEDIAIDKAVHRSINSRSAVLKVGSTTMLHLSLLLEVFNPEMNPKAS